MKLQLLTYKKPSNLLETELVTKVEQLIKEEELTDILELFVALSIYKLQVQGKYRVDPDLHQINLLKGHATHGLRIFRVGETDTVRVLKH